MTEKPTIRRRGTQVRLKCKQETKREEGPCSVNDAEDCWSVKSSVT